MQFLHLLPLHHHNRSHRIPEQFPCSRCCLHIIPNLHDRIKIIRTRLSGCPFTVSHLELCNAITSVLVRITERASVLLIEFWGSFVRALCQFLFQFLPTLVLRFVLFLKRLQFLHLILGWTTGLHFLPQFSSLFLQGLVRLPQFRGTDSLSVPSLVLPRLLTRPLFLGVCCLTSRLFVPRLVRLLLLILRVTSGLFRLCLRLRKQPVQITHRIIHPRTRLVLLGAA